MSGRTKDLDLYVTIKPIDALRTVSCEASGCSARATYSILVEQFANHALLSTKLVLLHARYCELCLRKAGPKTGMQFVDNAIFALVGREAAS